jgi:hypothetical protein
VVCRGEVSVRAAVEGPCVVAAGARLEGDCEAGPESRS